MTGGRPLILAAWLGIFIYGYLNAMLGIVLPNLMEKLKLNKSQAGVFFMISSIGLIVASVPSGLTMDALGTKLVVCVGLFLVAVAFWGLGVVGSSKALYSMAFVLGPWRLHGRGWREHCDFPGELHSARNRSQLAELVFRRRRLRSPISGDAGAQTAGAFQVC